MFDCDVSEGAMAGHDLQLRIGTLIFAAIWIGAFGAGCEPVGGKGIGNDVQCGPE